ncbi:uncharacterized protein LOC127281640 [Leptopilina boulardi]|uniref:uncharacterized protein LOC127281640 n=1 Tax=Leptopilina boulardi TaxID=63433 RepID=UPI0021F540A7|nr:uncharacterized protein LOC127281640 [Leptopilina boulardi]
MEERRRELTKMRVRKHRRMKKDLIKWQSLAHQGSIDFVTEPNTISSENEEMFINENKVLHHNELINHADSDEIENNEIESECAEDRNENLKIEDNNSNFEMDINDVAENEYQSSDLEDLLQNSENDEEEQLREWAIKGNISWVLISQLLLILRRQLMTQLPKTASIFLNLRTEFYIKSMTTSLYKNAEFVYFGIAKGLASCFNHSLHPDEIINLDINIDAAPLWKSTSNEFWPTLCRIQKIGEDIEYIKGEVKELRKKNVQYALCQETMSENLASKFEVKLPLQTMEEFEKLEELLPTNKELQHSLKSALLYNVDLRADLKKILRQILSALFSREVAMKFTASKPMPEKKILNRTNCCNLIEGLIPFKSMASKEKYSKPEIIGAMGYVLTRSYDWGNGRTERRNKKDNNVINV